MKMRITEKAMMILHYYNKNNNGNNNNDLKNGQNYILEKKKLWLEQDTSQIYTPKIYFIER